MLKDLLVYLLSYLDGVPQIHVSLSVSVTSHISGGIHPPRHVPTWSFPSLALYPSSMVPLYVDSVPIILVIPPITLGSVISSND